MKLGICISGQGTNLRNLVERGFEVVAVATNRPSCGGAAFARERGLPLAELSQRAFATVEDRDAAMRDFFIDHGVELVVDAGYDRVHSAPFLEAFGGRIINVHPSLLPAFPGLRAVEQALAYGVKVFGVTVHFVDSGIDTGPVILQRAVELPDARSPEEVLDVLRPVEHELLAAAVRLFAEGALETDAENPRRIAVGSQAG